MNYWLKMIVFAATLLVSNRVLALNAPIPEGFTTLESPSCSVSVPQKNEPMATALLDGCEEIKARIFKELGLDDVQSQKPVDVRLVSSPMEMKTVTPDGSTPPPWSSAVAYPEYNLVILASHHRGGGFHEDLEMVLEHEMSHLALRTALGGAPIPRWFSEGVAIQQSEKSSFRRIWLVWTAALGGNLLPLASIDRYPDNPGQINLAYAQAADFTGFLIRKGGWAGIRNTISKMAEGNSFEKAVRFSFGKPLFRLEKTWRSGLLDRWQWVPLVTGSGAVWGLIVGLFFVAYIAQRRRKKKRYKEMDLEERGRDRLIGGFEPGSPSKNHPGEPNPKVPTKIRVEDDIHTLH